MGQKNAAPGKAGGGRRWYWDFMCRPLQQDDARLLAGVEGLPVPDAGLDLADVGLAPRPAGPCGDPVF